MASGADLIRRIFRRRFGLATRKVAIRTDVPLLWRALFWIAILSVSLAFGRWIYDAGMRFAGFDRHESALEIERLTQQVQRLEADLERLQMAARSTDSRIQVETITQDNLSLQLKALQRENATLKEDVALFEGLVSGAAAAAGPRIARVSLEPGAKGLSWRFRVLVINPAAAKGAPLETRGELQFDVTVRQNGKDANISIPAQGSTVPAFQFVVKHFQRIEGDLRLPAGAVLVGGEVKLIQDGVLKARQVLRPGS